MNYASIKYADIANGPGCRASLFVSGCTHHCKECFNPETWDFCYGKAYTKEVEDEIVKSIEPDYIAGLTILGGDPMEAKNQTGILSLVKRVKEMGKSVWIYTGFTYDELMDEGSRCRTDVTDDIFEFTDVLVDGEFVLDKKDITLLFRGSSNQRLIDIKKTKETGDIALWNC